MKLVMAVISNKDVSKVLDAITKEGFFSSRISTTGQFLADGHTTLFIGTEDHKVGRQVGVASTLEGSLLRQPVDVEEYGAVAFVINVDEFRKL